MKRRRTSLLLTVIATVVVVGWFAHGFLKTWRHIPEAYAAWDTGTLLVEFMKQHDGQWPTSWDHLLTVLDSEEGRRIPLRGAGAEDVAYARSLRKMVAVDWAFDPGKMNMGRPVTPIGGGEFSTVWEGGEPNEMVRHYLLERASTRPSAAR